MQAAFNDHQTGGNEENDFELGVDFDDMVRFLSNFSFLPDLFFKK